MSEERERRTSGVRAEAASLVAEAERLRAEYEGGIAKAREAGETAKEAIRDEAVRAREQLLGQAREEATRMLQKARTDLQAESRRARELAAREAETIARQMAEKILGRRIA